MHRVCMRCGQMMISGFELGIKGSGMVVKLRDEDAFIGRGVSELKAAVCRNCGEVSLFIADPEEVQKK